MRQHSGGSGSAILRVLMCLLATQVSILSQTGESRKTNRLAREKSPYLLQHAHNPVDWYPWGPEAFARARSENQLIFLSIGYSTCYWCHVMEREVFENGPIAERMNRFFVNIKVDREERPDVDRIYMSALQGLTGSGGWPMSLFLTPDLKPFYGGSYIPPERFRELIERIQAAWKSEPEKIRNTSSQLVEQLRRGADLSASKSELELSFLHRAFQRFREDYDKEHAGFGQSPKFPRPAAFNFLLRYSRRFGGSEALAMTLSTLRKMREGGIYDQLGGGFHRYSVDRQWRVPHFEKMLYDQAQIAGAYIDAYQSTRDARHAETSREILGYVLRSLTDPEGGFCSAEDAESATDPAKPGEKREGAFYVWTAEETIRILGKDQGEIFNFAYGIKPEGNVSHDPHGVFGGKNILHVAHPVEETAKNFRKPAIVIGSMLAESRGRLLAERDRRPRPHLDDKILTSWNGLMISAFARAYQALGDPVYLRAAQRASDFVWSRLYDPGSRRLFRRYRDGEARHEGNLEDYACLTMGMLDLYEASLDIRWLRKAVELTAVQNTIFFDEANGGFFDTSGKDLSLLLRTKEDYDGVEPAGNSVAAMNLLRLSQMTDNREWRRKAERTFSLFRERLRQHPASMPVLLGSLDFHLDKPLQIILAGRAHSEDLRNMERLIHTRYIPNRIILLADGGSGQEFLSRHLPFLKQMKMLQNRATAYICEEYACKLPTTDLSVMARLLDEKPAK